MKNKGIIITMGIMIIILIGVIIVLLVNNQKESPKTTEPAEEKPFTSSISIQLPAPAFYNNADTTEGNVYTWNIKTDEPTDIKLQYVQYDGFAIGIIIAAGIVILILGAMKIIKHENQKRIGNSENLIK